MARFNLDNYVTVDDRIRRYYDDNPTGAITTSADWRDKTVIVLARVWVPRPDDGHGAFRDNPGVWATGMAYTNDITKDKALEKCETTAIGRALANAGFVKEGEQRPSREEMEDVTSHDHERLVNGVKVAALEVSGGDKDLAIERFEEAKSHHMVVDESEVDETAARMMRQWLEATYA